MLDHTACPGSRVIKNPQPEMIHCPFCGIENEIWTDEIQITCHNCGKKILYERKGNNCLDWCKAAKECVGEQAYNNYQKNKALTIREKLIKELEEYFGPDTKRINHAKKVLLYAKELLKLEKGDWNIVIPASILHDVGIKVAEGEYGSSAGPYQEKEGPQIARKILNKTGLKKSDIDEICEIIGHHHSPEKINTLNFKILYDADWLINLQDEVGDTNDKEKLSTMIDKTFLTETGKEIARRIYLSKINTGEVIPEG